jgi:hypothetical protein
VSLSSPRSRVKIWPSFRCGRRGACNSRDRRQGKPARLGGQFLLRPSFLGEQAIDLLRVLRVVFDPALGLQSWARRPSAGP